MDDCDYQRKNLPGAVFVGETTEPSDDTKPDTTMDNRHRKPTHSIVERFFWDIQQNDAEEDEDADEDFLGVRNLEFIILHLDHLFSSFC